MSFSVTAPIDTRGRVWMPGGKRDLLDILDRPSGEFDAQCDAWWQLDRAYRACCAGRLAEPVEARVAGQPCRIEFFRVGKTSHIRLHATSSASAR